MDFALIVANGVLFKETPDHPPIPEGIRLVRALEGFYSLCFSMPAYEPQSSKRVLVAERLREEGLVVPYVYWGDDHERHRYNLQPNVVSLFLSSNPNECAGMMRRGVTSVLFAHPSYMREEFRPDTLKETRAWDSIEEESKRQAFLRAQEERDESLEFISTLVDDDDAL